MDGLSDILKMNHKIRFTLLLLVLGCGPGWAVLPMGYHVHRYSSTEVYVAPLSQKPTTPIIPAKTIGLWWNDSWILGECHPLIRRALHSADDVMIADDNRRDFWIIDLRQTKSYGPYIQRSEFDKAVTQFQISDTPITFRPPPFTRMEEGQE